MRILIMAGGTGGHIFPALVVAERLKKNHDCDVFWLGTEKSLEESIVGEKFPFFSLPVSPLRGRGLGKRMLAMAKLVYAVGKAIYLLRKISPTVVVGFGGFVAGPGGIAAKILGKPLVIHEQNTVPGLTNQYLAKIAKSVLQAFPNAFPEKVAAKTVGNPIRESIVAVPPMLDRFAFRSGPLRLLVLGGSQGAQCLNTAVRAFLEKIPTETLSLEIWVQTGKKAYAQALKEYKLFPQVVKVSAFIEDISSAYAWADRVLCRAGAITLAELSAVGVGAFMVPYALSAGQHQLKNAQYVMQLGGGEIIEEEKLSPKILLAALTPYCQDRQRIYRSALAAYNSHIAQSSENICLHIINCASG